ncbi:hypothetical protein L218DRAFT_982188 [Marasmius fiardii PR-910]|nr:hypothetical protein L218DRAFT_982188 [Marasmius fiardii PR-910]
MSFTRASEFTIRGGEFNSVGGDQVRIVNNSVVSNPAYKSLWDAIAGVGASHNSQQRFPQPRCHPKTRKRVINVIINWLDTGSRCQPICWLSGPAGVGKSAIAQTIAETLERKGLVASFFFFRQDPKRNIPDYLMLTIAHGLVVNIPELRQPVTRRVAADPKILEANLKDQFTELIADPLQSAQRGDWVDYPHPSTTGRRPNLVIIDGLDECAGEDVQTHILNILAVTLGKQSDSPFPLRFLICSRPESWIREAFDSDRLRNLRKHVELDGSFCPDADIKRFLLSGFQEVVTNPKYSQVRFPVPWPSKDDIRVLVKRACGQFIYAATVLKFVQDGYCHPLEQLRIILGISQNSLRISLFQELDDLYRVILSTNSDCEGLLLILAAVFIIPRARYTYATPRLIEMLLGLPDGRVALTLRPLHSVLRIHGPDDGIVAFHTSFTDFLYDQSRSREHYLDRRRWHGFLVHKWLHRIVEECKLQRLPGPGNGSHEHDDTAAALMFLWLHWPPFCVVLPGPISDVVISSLQDLDLGAILTATISASLTSFKLRHKHKEEIVRIPVFLSSLLEKLKNITECLKTVDTPDERISRLIQHFETARKAFHVTVSSEIAHTFAMWTAINAAGYEWECDILTKRVSAEIIRYMEGNTSMPVAYYGLCPTSVQTGSAKTSEVPRCPQAPIGHHHINIGAASVLTLKALIDTLDDSLASLRTSRTIVANVLRLLRPHLCGTDSGALSLCRQALSFFRKKWGLSLKYQFNTFIGDAIISWLESFPVKYAHKVRALADELIKFDVIRRLPRTIQGGRVKILKSKSHPEVT